MKAHDQLQSLRASEPRSPIEDDLIDLCAELLLHIESLEARVANLEDSARANSPLGLP